MPDLKYAVTFAAIDRLTDKLSSFGGGFLNLGNRIQKCSTKLSETGESLTRFGERLSLDTMLMKDGAEHLRQLSDAISEPAFAMQKSLATTAALTGMAGEQIAGLKEKAIAFSNTHPGVTAEQYVEGFTRMRETFQDTNKAFQAENVAAMLARFGVDGRTAVNLFGEAYLNFGLDAKRASDQFYAAMQAGSVMPEDAQQFAQAIGRLGGIAATTKTPFSELLALAGTASQQLGGGGRGAMMFASMIRELVVAANEGKASIDFTHGLAGGLSQLRAQMAGLSTAEKMTALKGMMVSDPGMMLTYLDNLDKVAAKQRTITSSTDALGKGYKIATNNAVDLMAQLHQNADAFYDAVASPALPMYSAAIGWLTTEVQGLTSATEKHSTIAKDFVFGMSAAGNLAYYGATALSTFGMATMGLGSGMEALGYAIKGVTGAQWLFNLAIGANPIVIATAAVVGLGVAAYELYEHWNGVASFFSGLWDRIKSIFRAFDRWTGGWAASLGKTILTGIAGPFGMIASEIIGHWESIKAACEKIAGGIKSFFVGHSPPPAGPLHDLGRITIAETIADRIRPAPVLAAIRRTAAAAAIASTTIVAGAAGPALAGGGAGGIVINAPITINAQAGADTAALENIVLRALDNHRYELARILDQERERKERTVLA